jgi:thiamine biosynthesis lipoprotein
LKSHCFFVELENEALTTSASYERYQEIDGVKHSHIISKQNLDEKILSATVVSKSVLESGVYSTSLMIDKNIKTKNKKYLIKDDLSVKR